MKHLYLAIAVEDDNEQTVRSTAESYLREAQQVGTVDHYSWAEAPASNGDTVVDSVSAFQEALVKATAGLHEGLDTQVKAHVADAFEHATRYLRGEFEA